MFDRFKRGPWAVKRHIFLAFPSDLLDEMIPFEEFRPFSSFHTCLKTKLDG
jgi:hypothetical protein